MPDDDAKDDRRDAPGAQATAGLPALLPPPGEPDITLNDRPAPYRRDLRGADLAYEITLLFNRMAVGDVLIIPDWVMQAAGGPLQLTFPWDASSWRNEAQPGHCVRRDA